MSIRRFRNSIHQSLSNKASDLSEAARRNRDRHFRSPANQVLTPHIGRRLLRVKEPRKGKDNSCKENAAQPADHGTGDNAGAHLGLARILESRSEFSQARLEATSANRLQVTADGYLLLADIEVKQGKPAAALEYIERVLKLDPANRPAAAMQREIEARSKTTENDGKKSR